jgi:hypothetical protein
MRSILEIVINLEYIRQQPRPRAKLFQEYAIVARWRYWEAASKTFGEDMSDTQYKTEKAELEAQFQRVKSQYLKTRKGKKQSGIRNHWADEPNIREIAKKVNLESTYDLFYSLLSWHVHCTPMAADSLIHPNERGLTVIIAPGEDKKGEYLNAIFLTCHFSLMLIIVFDSVFKTGFEKEIEATCNENDNIFRPEKKRDN